MGTAGLQVIGQVDHLADGFQIPREENHTAWLVLFDERSQIGRHRRAQKSDHEELPDFVA
jgi:hypothetical protein